MIHVEVSRLIEAPADDLYAIVSDYEVGHPAILPKPYFKSLTVEEGGQGEGTVISVRMEVLGVTRDFRMVVHEDEPGRVLTETTIGKEESTTFTFEPRGQHTLVTIATVFQPRSGLTGFLERLMTPRIMRRIYKKELQKLADYAKQSRA